MLLLGLAVIGIKLATPRQSAVRTSATNRARCLKTSLDEYRREHKTLPKSLQEMVGTYFGPEVPAEFAYIGGRGGLVAYRKEAFRAVRKGKPWGGLEEKAEEDIPEARLVLADGKDPETMPEAEFRTKYGDLITPR